MLIPSDSRHDYNDISDEAEEFVQSALNALSAHIAILDTEGRIIGVNAAWQNFADHNGYQDPSYGIGTNYLEVCDASAKLKSKDATIVARGIRDIIQGRVREFQLEYPCHSPTERRWFVVRVSRFEWYDQLRVIVAHQNVSELKRVQIELAESKSRIEAIIDNVNNGIITVNSRGMIETANRAAARIFGYQLEEMSELHITDLTTERFDNESAFHKLNGQYGHEITGMRKDGKNFPMYFSLNRLKLDDGAIYTCIIQDITYRKRMESEIIERERMQVALDKERELRVLKNRFLSMMGHELNTPLASISLSYDMLKKYADVSTPEENEQALDNIHQQVGHLRDMVKDVMTLSRAESEGLDMTAERVNLITYCQDIVEEFHFIHSKTHSVDFECDTSEIFARIDQRMLRRVFTNLLSNAIKYSPKGETVLFRLRLDSENALAIIEVSDKGIGIPEEDHTRLFEPFHRAINADKLPGTGLGLAIAKQAIELHNGTIDFSTELNVGTTFIITLPLEYMSRDRIG
ncbi:MAG: PAS domain-containing sensor histidine kinase [Anaerolineae bacterium]